MKKITLLLDDLISKTENLKGTGYMNHITSIGFRLLNRYKNTEDTKEKLDILFLSVLLSVISSLPPNDGRKLLSRIRK